MDRPQPQSALPLGRLVLVGVLVPAAFAWLDHRWLTALAGHPYDTWFIARTLALFVVQVGVFGVLCGRLIASPFWRWLIYGWCWLLVDLQTLSAVLLGVQSLPASLLAAQAGLFVIWALLGTTWWVARFAVSLVIAAILGLLLFSLFHDANVMRLFFTQTATLTAICGVLRWRRYRLVVVRPAAAGRETTTGQQLSSNQFGVRHMLIWTSSLALVLASARALDLFAPIGLSTWDGRQRLMALSLGVLVAMVLVVALWAALGEGCWRLRWLVLILAIVTSGIVLFISEGATSQGRIFFQDFRQYWNTSWYWAHIFRYEARGLTWIALAGGLLFATLLMPRTLGYRLARPLDKDRKSRARTAQSL